MTRKRKPRPPVKTNFARVRKNVVRVARRSSTLVEVVLSMDVLDTLVRANPLAEQLLESRLLLPDPYDVFRLQFGYLDEMYGIRGFYMRIEPPTFDPQGHRLLTMDDGRSTQRRAVLTGRRLGLNMDVMRSFRPERIFNEQTRAMGGGMVVIPPEEYMLSLEQLAAEGGYFPAARRKKKSRRYKRASKKTAPPA